MAEEEYLSRHLEKFEVTDQESKRFYPGSHFYSIGTPQMVNEIDSWAREHASRNNFVAPEHVKEVGNVYLPRTKIDFCPNSSHSEHPIYTDDRGVKRCAHKRRIFIDPTREIVYEIFDISASRDKEAWIIPSETERDKYASVFERQIRQYGSEPFSEEVVCDAIIDDENAQLSLEYILRKHNLSKNHLCVSHGTNGQLPAVSLVSPRTHVGEYFNEQPVISVRDPIVLKYGFAGLAKIGQLWWEQGLPGTAPVWRLEGISDYSIGPDIVSRIKSEELAAEF